MAQRRYSRDKRSDCKQVCIGLVDVIMPTRQGVDSRRRCVRKPTDHQAILLSRLGLTMPRQLENKRQCSEDFRP